MASVSIILDGFPGKSSRGYFGWCTVSLIKSEEQNIIVDTGSYGDKWLLLSKLRGYGIKPQDIDIVILTHLHYDHCINAVTFPNAEIVISEKELDYVFSDKPSEVGDTFIPHTIIERLTKERNITEIKKDTHITENISVINTPGHTPGCISVKVEEENKTTVICGDCPRSAWELIKGESILCFGSPKDFKNTIKRIRKIANLIIPGHDRPFTIRKDEIIYQKSLNVDLYLYLNPKAEKPTVYTVTDRGIISV